MFPSRQRLDALHKGADRRVVLGKVEAEFVRRIIEISDHREVDDGRPVAENVGSGREALVDDAERVGEPALEESFPGLVAGRGEIAQESIWPEIAVDFL